MQTFVEWWQHLPERIDPVFLELGPLQLRYYGLMFLSAVFVSYLLVRWRVKHDGQRYDMGAVDDYYTWVILGVVLGGRLGYVFFYNFSYFMKYPLEIFLPFDTSNGFELTGIGGMSYHGGLLGVFIATYFFCIKKNFKLWHWIDFVVVTVPAGYVFGRLGNFLNGELWGRVTEGWWGMYFPGDSSGLLRHPSQLYEAALEGALLFAVLWVLRKKNFVPGALFAFYLIGYGLVRFLIEFTRQPDSHIGFVFAEFSLGQVLCFGMIVIGGLLYAKLHVQAANQKT